MRRDEERRCLVQRAYYEQRGEQYTVGNSRKSRTERLEQEPGREKGKESDEDRQPVPGPDLRPCNREKSRKATGRRHEDRCECERSEASKRCDYARPRSHDGEKRHSNQPEETNRSNDAERRRLPLVLRDLCGVFRLPSGQGVDAMAVHRKEQMREPQAVVLALEPVTLRNHVVCPMLCPVDDRRRELHERDRQDHADDERCWEEGPSLPRRKEPQHRRDGH